MPGAGTKTPRALRTWMLVGVVCWAVVSSCLAEIAADETVPPLNLERQEDVSLEEIRRALLDNLLEDLVERADGGRLFQDSLTSDRRGAGDDMWGAYAAKDKRGHATFHSGLTRLGSGFTKRNGEELGFPFGEGKRGNSGFFGSSQLTNLGSGFKRSDDAAYLEDKRGRQAFTGASRLTNVGSGFKRSDGGDKWEDKRGRNALLGSSRLTNVGSGFFKRSDEEGRWEDKRGRNSFMGASQLTNLGSGFKRSDDGGHWEDKRGRSAFTGSSRLTNVGSGFKRNGNFNSGPMVHIPSGFVERKKKSANSS